MYVSLISDSLDHKANKLLLIFSTTVLAEM